MTIHFHCTCGRKLRAPSESAGRRGRCPACGHLFTVPAALASKAVEADLVTIPDAEPEPVPVAAAATVQPAETRDEEFGEIPLAEPPPPPVGARRAIVRPTPPTSPPPPPPPPRVAPTPAIPLALSHSEAARPYLYVVLLLVLIPLGWSTFSKSASEQQTLKARLHATIKAHPDVLPKLEALSEEASDAELFAILPGHRFEGAWLPRDTWVHWGLAAASGVGFLAALMLLFPLGHAKPHQLAGVALFTGTVGIVMLLAFQWIAFHMPLFRGGRLALLLDLIWLIGQSYRMALGDHGFFLSFLGFTAGVGFCEEACKALPLILKSRSTGYASWRQAMLWGLISGVGFGVSEGITYCADYYNGVSGPGVYAVRFVSCVGLHAIWAGAVGITLYRRQGFLAEAEGVFDWIFRLMAIVIVPMVLHGAYDTLLKQHQDVNALAVALVSFGWFAFQIELAKRQYDEPAVAPAVA